MTESASTASNSGASLSEAAKEEELEHESGGTDIPSPATRGRVVRLSTLVVATAGVLLVTLVATLSLLLVKARGQVSARDAAAADKQHAESVATDYAVGAATINYQDLPAWTTKLKANTAPAMASKFDATAPKLQQILLPLKWVSNATPIAAKVDSVNGSIYKVDVFVNVNSTTAQTPDGTQTTVTYNVTVDKQSGWKVTDVGGTMAALTSK
ncbi:hypothetical protein [Mycobacteroides abscessus]|uniref:hypothetical protein n=1 Tax=Mycobacteroides abscessus TaxID=36809 RepID=UPI002105FF3C|nr:hypothetical protein [Mycobacteroides abscessus]